MARRGRNAEPEVESNWMIEFMRNMVNTMQQQTETLANAIQQQNATLANALQQQAASFQEQAAIMREQLAANTEQMRQAREDGGNNDRNRERVIGNLDHKQWKDFHSSSPPSFEGEYDPKKALRWIDEMEELFEVFHNTDAQRVSYGTFMLKGDAARWWKGAKSLMVAKGLAVTWESFKETFLDKYLPRNVRDQKEMEFLSIKQGDTPFEKFLAEYEDLAEYSTQLKANPNDRWKCVHFVNALNPELHEKMITMGIEDFAILVYTCRLAISGMARLGPGTQQFNSSKRKQFGYFKGMSSQKNDKGKKPKAGQPQASGPACPKCSKFHGSRPCLVGQGICFKCGKPGHFARNCPQVQKPAEAPRPPNQGRIYTLKGKEVAPSDDLIKD